MTTSRQSPASAREQEPGQGQIDYLILGHVAVDRVDPTHVLFGGTASYASLAVAAQGGQAAIHTSATYEPGLVDLLAARGVWVVRIPSEYSTCFFNEYRDGQRTQRLESRAASLAYEQLLAEWRNPPLVHLAPLCQELDASIVERFPKSFVGVTPQGWLRAWDETGVVRPSAWQDAERVLRKADAVVVSEEDLPDPSAAVEWAKSARLLVVTRGAEGCDVFAQGEEAYHSPAFKPAREIDPTGAGDAFAAAFFWHVKQTGNWREAADWANCVASFVVEKRGVGSVPKLADVEKRWKTRGRRGEAGPR